MALSEEEEINYYGFQLQPKVVAEEVEMQSDERVLQRLELILALVEAELAVPTATLARDLKYPRRRSSICVHLPR